MHESPQLFASAFPHVTKGFTLLELIVVISIMVIIVSLCIPAATSIQKSFQLTAGAQMVGNQLGLARQVAITRNHSVEIRFYQFGDSEVPGEQVTVPGSGQYRAFQAFEIQETGSANAMGKMQRLPVSIVMDSGVTLSSLISGFVPMTGGTLGVSLPRVQTQYNAVSFRFLPDGSTNLAKTERWFLTLHNMNDGNALALPPKNFATLQVNPSNGHIKSYRP